MTSTTTGETARELALYASSCCEEELIFDRGDCFCRCPRCESLCRWEVVERLVSWKDLELLPEELAA